MNALKVKREPMGRWWERLGKAKMGLVHTGKGEKGSTAFNKSAVGNLLSEKNSSNSKTWERVQTKILLETQTVR